MSSNNLDNLWTLMSKHNFKMVSESQNENFLCVICDKLIIDAYHSECGCRYCCRCINEYLSGEIKNCPVNKEDCKEVNLIVGINVTRNNVINKKISKVKVQCQFNEELMKMEEHLRICIKQKSECPYLKIGCNNKEVKDKMLDHLNDNTWQHTHLLIDYIEKMNNERGVNKEDFERCKREITSLKEDSLVKEKKIEEQGRMLEDVLNIIKEIKKDSVEKETKIIHLINEVECLKEGLNTKDIQVANLIQEMTKTTKSLEDIKDHSKRIKDEVKNLKKEYTKYQEDSRSSFNTLKEESIKREETTKKNVNQSIKESKKRVDSLNERIETLYLKTNVKVGEILFKVDRFSERKTSGEIVYSPYFYSHFNGYKLRLQVYPGGLDRGKGTHLSLFLVICKGDYDDELSWPYKHLIKLSVVNQSTGDDHKCEILSYSSESEAFKHYFNKPMDKDNLGYTSLFVTDILGRQLLIGRDLFISLGELQKVTLNDVVLVRARVSSPV